MWWCSRLPRLHQAGRAAALLALLCMLGACGFALRGSYAIPYPSVHISGANTPFVGALRSQVASATQLSPTASAAAAQINIVSDIRDKKILSLSGAGRVREYELKLLITYQVVEANGSVLIATNEIFLTRIMSYDDALVIAKQQEETQLFRDMEMDAASQILRRMIAVKKP